MNTVIDIKHIKYSRLSVLDDVGTVFFSGGRVFRAIRHASVEDVREMFSCGLVDELSDNGIIPRTWITEYSLEGYGLVIEHESCFPVTYPFEWSFSMLRDAAIVVLKANILARKYDYQTKDCHGFNVVFDGAEPRFVDLGSFVKTDPVSKGWAAYEEFLRFYYYPLKIWKNGNEYIARKMLLGNTTMPHSSYLLYLSPLFRFVNPAWLANATRVFCKLKTYSRGKSGTKSGGNVMNIARDLADRHLLPFMEVNLDAWLRKIEKLSLKRYSTLWGNYHDKFHVNGAVLSTSRFDRIIEIVRELKPGSILELAGNQGVLSMMLASALPEASVICTDFDEIAVDAMYRKLKHGKIKISPVLLDFIYPLVVSYGENPSDRFLSEAVLALAVTHHLLLTGKLSIESVFEKILSYSSKYVLVEFMPLGLHDGNSAPPVPEWYTTNWFRDNFCKQFELISEEMLEENRILFVGRLK